MSKRTERIKRLKHIYHIFDKVADGHADHDAYECDAEYALQEAFILLCREEGVPVMTVINELGVTFSSSGWPRIEGKPSWLWMNKDDIEVADEPQT